MAGIDADVLRHALKIARENGFAEVELTHGDDSFRATLEPNGKRQKPNSIVVNSAAEPAEAVSMTVKAPQVGYFKFTDPVVLAVGAKLEKGQKVGVIAALGLFNDVESPASGEVFEVLVQDGDPVQFGQALARLHP